jgi:hypothetical protein
MQLTFFGGNKQIVPDKVKFESWSHIGQLRLPNEHEQHYLEPISFDVKACAKVDLQ